MNDPVRTRAPRSDAAKNRAALLDAARSELNRDPDASLDTIAAAAGLSRRAVYGHFPSRDALIAELAQLRCRSGRRRRRRASTTPTRCSTSRSSVASSGTTSSTCGP